MKRFKYKVRDEQVTNPFPKLMVSSTGAVFLMINKSAGTKLTDGKGGCTSAVGTYDTAWNYATFRDFSGTLELTYS